MNRMEITKREVIFSSVIICVMLILGIVISDKINDSLMNKYQEYNAALQIEDDTDLFQYGMRTNVGRAFVHGNLEAVGSVSYPGVQGQYGSMTKDTERYTMHTRTVTRTRTVNGKTQTYTTTEHYWTWDRINRETIHVPSIAFLGVEFPYGTIDYFPEYEITKIDCGFNLREVYYGSDLQYTGTIYTILADDTISNTSFYCDQEIDEVIKSLEVKWQIVVFWIFWILLIAAATYGFYYIDNRWLEG